MYRFLRHVRRSLSPTPILVRSSCFYSSPFGDRYIWAEWNSPQWIRATGIEVERCYQVGIYWALGKSHTWLTKKVAGQLVNKIGDKMYEYGVYGSIEKFTVYGDEKSVSLSIRNTLCSRNITFQSVPDLEEMDMYRSRDVLAFAEYYKPESYVILIGDGGSKLVHAARILKHLGYDILVFIPNCDDVSWQLREVASQCVSIDSQFSSASPPSAPPPTTPSAAELSPSLPYPSTSLPDIPLEAYPYPSLRAPPNEVLPDNMRSYPFLDPSYYTLEKRIKGTTQVDLPFLPKVPEFRFYCPLRAADSWVIKESAGRVYGELKNKLFELGIDVKERRFNVFGDSLKLRPDVRKRLYKCGISLIWTPDHEDDVEKEMAKYMGVLTDPSIVRDTKPYKSPTYIVLMCDRGNGLVCTVANLQFLGYHVILAIPKGANVCPALRLTAEHCILMD